MLKYLNRHYFKSGNIVLPDIQSLLSFTKIEVKESIIVCFFSSFFNFIVYASVMVNKCCVPRCNSNYDSSVANEGIIISFSFPKDKNVQRIWLRRFLRHNLIVTKHTGVRIKNFNDDYVIKGDNLPGQ